MGCTMSRNLLIVICIFLVIAFAIAYADLYHKWQDEKWNRIFSESLAGAYERDAEHYKQLYYDCLGQGETESSQFPTWDS